MSQPTLTPEQQAEAQQIEEKVLATVLNDVRQMAQLMASKEDRELLGQTEFEMRDLAHRIAATMIEEAVNQRSKKGVPR